MPFTKSHANLQIINTVSVAAHNLFMIVSENISIMKTPLQRNASPFAKKKDLKGIKAKAISLENANPPSIPEKNATNSQTFFFTIMTIPERSFML